jgi:hypothetical protein
MSDVLFAAFVASLGSLTSSTLVPSTDLVPVSRSGVDYKATVANMLAAGLKAPPAIGGTTPSTGAFTTLSASSGITFQGGSNGVGSIYTDGNWGGLIRGRSGAIADLALESSSANIGLKMTAAGNITMPFDVAVTGALTVTGITTSSRFVVDGAKVMSGTGQAQSQVRVSDSWTGTASTSDVAFLNSFITTSDTIAASSSGVNQVYLNYAFGGASMTGYRTALAVQAGIGTQSGNATGGSYVAGGFTFNAGANDHGTAATAGNAMGQAFAINPVVHFNSSATYWGAAVAAEFDVWLETGSSVLDKIGVQIVQVTGDNVQGTRDDVALSLNNQFTQASSKGWKMGIEFGRLGGYFPMDPTATLIGMGKIGGTALAATGIDWSGITFSSYSLNLPGFTVNGSGVATALYYDASTGNALTATGTTRADALALTKAVNRLTTVAASTGVILPASATVGIGGVVEIYHDGANVAKIYAAGSDTIDGVAGSTGVSLTNGKRCRYRVVAANTWISAQLGVVSA